MNIKELTKEKILICDGAMGTMLQSRGLKPGALPELLNLTNPQLITQIHKEYIAAGAEIITANTFQANPLKCKDHNIEEIISAGINCVKKAGAKYAALDVGPLGQLLQPLGTLSFEDAYRHFKQIVKAGAAAGADLILFETFSDLYEAKAAIVAAKENTNLPVICSLTFQDDGRTFIGCDPVTAAVTLSALGLDALGLNCSVGPKELQKTVDEILKYSAVPVIVQPNAGLPQICGEDARYDVSAQDFAKEISVMADKGVSIVGGCCGTTPEYIKEIKSIIGSKKPVRRGIQSYTACTSGLKTTFIGGATVIGERINPTGKKKLQAALRSGDKVYIVSEAIEQTRAGSDILDVNAGLPELDEPAVLSKTVRDVQEVSNLPLQIDSADPSAIEAAVRIYNGKPVINSVNGKKEVMDKIFPVAKKYGALVVGLTLDENGIPPQAEGRFEIAKRIVERAQSYGIPPSEILIDCLVLTASAQQEQVIETLRAVKLVKERLGCKTVLGVSNVSFGLPQREILNATFLAAALGAGLDAAIINPLSARYREVVDAFRVLSNVDEGAERFVALYGAAAPQARPQELQPSPLTLKEIILQGRKEESAAKVRAMLAEKIPPMEIINNEFIPALDETGKNFESGKIFLPQLMMSAQTVQNGFEVIKEFSAKRGEERKTRGRILLATVEGDIHDIGKNIVKMVLENYGFEIIDLGKDVKIKIVVDAIKKYNIKLAGLSALMTTTVLSMKNTISAVKEAGLDCKFFVGGAVLNEEYKNFTGADFYTKDAMESAAVANKFFGHSH